MSEPERALVADRVDQAELFEPAAQADPASLGSGLPEAPQIPPPATTGWWEGAASSLGLALAGTAVFIALWQLVASVSPDLPTPAETIAALTGLLSSPLHDFGPNDQGIFRLLGTSLRRVFFGFGLAAAVGIPLGFLFGGSRLVAKAINPLVQVLRPVSPLAWYPICLVLLHNAGQASVLTIGITALWPTLINTAVGVAGIPQDHRDVARVFRFSKLKYVRQVLLPYSMTSIITGMRLSMGIAWMVIVATEMLSGGSGIGFFVWDSYNNNNNAAVVSAIIFIGLIGFALDYLFARLAQKFDYAGGTA
ncbi:MAG: nitrate ABC transporter permease [Egibacteraceae bacterium]